MPKYKSPAPGARRPLPGQKAVSDAPRDYIEGLLKAIVGIEIVIERLEGKWKVSQNRSQKDQRRMAAGLQSEPQSAALGQLKQQRMNC